MTRHSFMYAFDAVHPNPVERACFDGIRRIDRERFGVDAAFPFPGDVAGVATTGCLPRRFSGRDRVVFDYIAAGM